MSRKNRRAQIEERRKKVAANLLGGLTYRQMAGALDVSLGTIANDVKIILGRWEREQVQDVSEWVELESRRLERMLNAIWNDAIDGKSSAIDRALRIMERRAKLLGLDAPSKQQISGADGSSLTVIFRQREEDGSSED